MKLELNAYHAICGTRMFKINGITADYKDFGEKYDAAADPSKPYYCGNMVFEPKEAAGLVLDKYGITTDEYAYICMRLKDMLSFGLCRLCG